MNSTSRRKPNINNQVSHRWGQIVKEKLTSVLIFLRNGYPWKIFFSLYSFLLAFFLPPLFLAYLPLLYFSLPFILLTLLLLLIIFWVFIIYGLPFSGIRHYSQTRYLGALINPLGKVNLLSLEVRIKFLLHLISTA